MVQIGLLQGCRYSLRHNSISNAYLLRKGLNQVFSL